MSGSARIRASLALGTGLAVVWLLAGSVTEGAEEVQASAIPAHRCLVAAGSGDLPFERDFNPFGQPLDLTSGGIYEPLVVVTAADGGHQYNWLASGFRWSRDRRTLTITVRHGVQWTDGAPLTNKDVAYTLTAGYQAKAMDQIGLRRLGNEVVWVRAVGTDQVAVRLNRIDTTWVTSVLANNVRVVPQHVFAHIEHVGSWSNPHPVGTGPFAVVERFGTQSYILDRNPNYWRHGAPHIACIERVVASSQESAVLQAVTGSLDLTNDLFLNADHVYVAHDRPHFHYFYPANSPGIGLFLDDTSYPFSIVALRKAISRAVDRKLISRYAESGYAPTVDALGINRAWPGWISKDLAAASKELATYDPAAARRLLIGAGFSYDGGTLLDPKGRPVVINATVPAGWVDWFTVWTQIQQDLGRVGITVKIGAVPTFGAWTKDAFSTRKATLLWNNAVDTDSPYTYFKEHLDTVVVCSVRPQRLSGRRLGALPKCPGDTAARTVQSDLRPSHPASHRRETRARVPAGASVRSTVRGADMVDVQHPKLCRVPVGRPRLRGPGLHTDGICGRPDPDQAAPLTAATLHATSRRFDKRRIGRADRPRQHRGDAHRCHLTRRTSSPGRSG